MVEEEANLKEELEGIREAFIHLIKLPPQFRKGRKIEKQIKSSLDSILEEIEGKNIIISAETDFTEEDIQMVRKKAGVSFEEARKRLEKSRGDLAKAIIM